ncbi:Two pore domain potassium channel family protein [Paraburkholderia sacchari]|uniref:potassium channel family protein n=1 Tax=Paraburkholderia sacchari TaxID=159450 RepID=UPI0039A41AEF
MLEKARPSTHGPLRAGHVVEEFARTLWYLRAPLAALFVLFLLLSAAMYYVGGPIDTRARAPSAFGDTLYFCTITALTIGYGDVVPTTLLGRIDSVLIGVQGVLAMSMVTAAFVRAVQEAARRAHIEDETGVPGRGDQSNAGERDEASPASREPAAHPECSTEADTRPAS